MNMTYLVELVAEVYRVDVVAFEVGEHDNLLMNRFPSIELSVSSFSGGIVYSTYEENHREQQSRRHHHREEK